MKLAIFLSPRGVVKYSGEYGDVPAVFEKNFRKELDKLFQHVVDSGSSVGNEDVSRMFPIGVFVQVLETNDAQIHGGALAIALGFHAGYSRNNTWSGVIEVT